MVELEGGTVALRILGDLWTVDAVDTGTAVWLVERVLKGDRPEDEQKQATGLLFNHAAKLMPESADIDQDWEHWPAFLDVWPSHLCKPARNDLLVMAVKALIAREPAYWQQREVHPLNLLDGALEDTEFRDGSSFVLAKLDALGMLADFEWEMDDAVAKEVHDVASAFDPAAWFSRLVSELEPWSRGEAVHIDAAPQLDMSATQSEHVGQSEAK